MGHFFINWRWCNITFNKKGYGIMNDKYKSARRKTWAFYTVQLICALSAYKAGIISWPLAALSGGCFLVYVGAVSAEKVLLRYFDTIKK
jgi:hypothetical protein